MGSNVTLFSMSGSRLAPHRTRAHIDRQSAAPDQPLLFLDADAAVTGPHREVCKEAYVFHPDDAALVWKCQSARGGGGELGLCLK